jgi:hypothetical protein
MPVALCAPELNGSGVVTVHLRPCNVKHVNAVLSIGGENANLGLVVEKRSKLAYGQDATAVFNLRAGGYSLDINDGSCLGYATFSVLAGRSRSINIHLKKTATSSPDVGEQTIYKIPAGDVAGRIPCAGVSLRLINGKGESESASISGNDFYFDNIPGGKYTIDLKGANWHHRVAVQVPSDFRLNAIRTSATWCQ